MLAVPGDADLVSEFADLCVRGSAGDSELVDCGVGVRGGGWVPDREVKAWRLAGVGSPSWRRPSARMSLETLARESGSASKGMPREDATTPM